MTQKGLKQWKEESYLFVSPNKTPINHLSQLHILLAVVVGMLLPARYTWSGAVQCNTGW